MTSRSKHSCCPARTSVTVGPPSGVAALGREPQVMPQNGAAEAGATRPNTVTATAARTNRRPDGERVRGLFMAGLQWCAPPEESPDTRAYTRCLGHAQLSKLMRVGWQVLWSLPPATTPPRERRWSRVGGLRDEPAGECDLAL